MLIVPVVIAAAVGCGDQSVATPGQGEARAAAKVKPAKLPPLQIRTTPSGSTVISLDSDVHFGFDSAEPTAAARMRLRDEVLPRVLGFLAEPGAHVALRGYTDGVGDAEHNLRLSSRRAEAVRSFLIAAGASADRLHARGFGELLAGSSRPRPDLRRVDVVLGGGRSR